MKLRDTIRDLLLFAAALLVGIIIGAEVYQRISLIPEWGGNLPDSLITYFRGTRAAASIGRFWTTMLPPTALFVAIAIAANWTNRARRKALGAAALFFFTALIWTAVWFVPQGVVPLMAHAGEGMSPQEITARAQAWIFWDWFRMALAIAAFVSMLKALTIGAPASATAHPDR